jgi:hypothetical protein
MVDKSNKGPYVTIGLTEAEHAFLTENCEVNIHQMLMTVQSLSRENAMKIVGYIEHFKAIKGKLEEAKETQTGGTDG